MNAICDVHDEPQDVMARPWYVPRRADRVKVPADTAVRSNGFHGTLVDLSPGGAQIVSRSILRPNELVRLVLRDDDGPVRLGGIVAWSKCELVAGSVQFRVGIEFDEPSVVRLRQAFGDLVRSSCLVTHQLQ